MNQQAEWNDVGLRIAQGLMTSIEMVRQLDVQEASLVIRVLGKNCIRKVNEGVGHQLGIALIETSDELAMQEMLILKDVLKRISGIIQNLDLVANTEEDHSIVTQLEEVVTNCQA
ncbi:recombinase [Desulfosporosinus sp. SB140]|uniref:recombinase n=1 Tax=Desulfosporosinus paludis TaxID=3115649 RepID=UPI00388EF348